MEQVILTNNEFVPLPGWPCAVNASIAPSIDDILSKPTAETLLPQVLALTPRGPAWGTDEAGDGMGAAPVQRQFWTALAMRDADEYAALGDTLAQAFPSLVTWSLDDWAAEYGLPDPCVTDAVTDATLLTQVRAKFALVGASSPDYVICVAAALGYPCFIEEFNPARIGGRIGDRLYGKAWGDAFRVHAPTVTVTPARIGARIGDRLASWGNTTLECAIRTAAQPQTVPIFAYDLDPDGGGGGGFTLDDDDSGGDPLSC
jgi:uncharacterized protein YmfQ (DUF2313 family)